MATSASPLPLSPGHSTHHFQWPSQHHAHSHHHFVPPPPHYPYEHSDHSLAFDLPDRSSPFGHSFHTGAFTSAFGAVGGLPSPDSPESEADGASLHGTTSYPSLSSVSSSSPHSPASSSFYSAAPSPPAVSQPTPHISSTAALNNKQHSSTSTTNRRRRRQTEEPSHDQADSDSDTTESARRVKHRQIDAVRRAREQTAISPTATAHPAPHQHRLFRQSALHAGQEEACGCRDEEGQGERAGGGGRSHGGDVRADRTAGCRVYEAV